MFVVVAKLVSWLLSFTVDTHLLPIETGKGRMDGKSVVGPWPPFTNVYDSISYVSAREHEFLSFTEIIWALYSHLGTVWIITCFTGLLFNYSPIKIKIKKLSEPNTAKK